MRVTLPSVLVAPWARFCHIPLKDQAQNGEIPDLFLVLEAGLGNLATFWCPGCRKEPGFGPVFPRGGFLPVNRVDSEVCKKEQE